MVNYNEETMKFSVLIPVYNVEEYLKDCLDSVLNQTYSNYEIIITNDGSTDRSLHICEQYAQKDKRIQIYSQKNQGLLMARRKSISNSTGDYCLFLDSDDSWKQDTLETVYKTIMETKADLVMFNWDRMTNNKLITSKPLFKDQQLFLEDTKNKFIEKFITTNKLNSLCLKAVKSSVIDVENDYSYAKGLTMGEDALQTIPLLMNSRKIIYIQKPLYNYRINEESSTNLFNPKHILDINVVNGSKINFLREIERPDLLYDLSKRYMNTVTKQIMNSSNSGLSNIEKLEYLQTIRESEAYKFMNRYNDYSGLILPVKIIIKELNKENYKSVSKISKVFSLFWGNINGFRTKIKRRLS